MDIAINIMISYKYNLLNAPLSILLNNGIMDGVIIQKKIHRFLTEKKLY